MVFMNNRAVSYWLFACCVAIFIMVAVGGLTRLTDSGLSIVEWKPITGVLPPMDDAEWNDYFTKYQKIPQYSEMNKGMSLAEFKGIFWLEYFHRLLGRVIGVLFAVPFFYFLAKKKLPPELKKKCWIILCLIGFQGAVGWFMVSSGLSVRTDVSQYRLAIHLGVAVFIYSLIFFTALSVRLNQFVSITHRGGLERLSMLVVCMIFFMMMLGAFVAGTNAGYAYTTFPLMDGKFVPDGLYSMKPWWINHFENMGMIQFQHRLMGLILFSTASYFAYRLVKADFNNISMAIALIAALILQICLGALTVHSFGGEVEYADVYAYQKVFRLPIIIATLHQVNALAVLTISLRITHKLLRN